MKLHKITFCTIFILPLLMGWNASQSAAQTAAEPSIQYGHTHDITSVRWSPDNRRLVSYSAADYYIRMWDVDSGRLIWSAYTEILQKKDEYFTLGGFAWSPDQTLIATHSGNGTVQVWNAIDGKLKWNADAHTESASVAVFSHDGKYLLSAGEKDKVHALKLSDVSSGKLILEFAGDPGVVIAATFSADDKTIKTGNLDAEVSEWEVSSGRRLTKKKVKLCQGVYAYSRGIAYDHGLNRLSARCGEKAVVRDVGTDKIIRLVDLDNDYAETMAFSRDDKQFLSNRSGYQRIVNLQTGEFKDVHEYGIGSTVDLNNDGTLLAAGGGIYVATVQITTVKTNQIYKQLEGHPGIIRGLAFSPDGKEIASGGGDTIVRLWNSENGSLLGSFMGHTKMVTAVIFSVDGKTLISASEDETIRIWDIATRTTRKTIPVEETIKMFALNRDGSRLLTTGDRSGFKLWDTSDWHLLREFNTTESEPSGLGISCCGSRAMSVAFSPDDKLILSGHGDGTVKVWDEKQPQPVGVINSGSRGIRACYTSNGKMIAIAGDANDHLAKIWDGSTGKFVRLIRDESFSYILAMASNRNSDVFATSGLGDTLNLWNSATGDLIRNLSHGYSADDAITFSADGQLIAAGGDNQNIAVWRVDNGDLRWQLQPRDSERERLDIEKRALFNRLKSERDAATKSADAEIASWKNPVTITFEHYGNLTDVNQLRMGEYSKPHKKKEQPAETADGIWLRLKNNSSLPITIGTQSMYIIPKGGCPGVTTPEKVRFGLCNGQEVALRYGIIDKDGNGIPQGFDFGAIQLLPPGWSVVFSIDRSDVENGQSIEGTFKFQKIDERDRYTDYGSGLTVYFRASDLPSRRH